MDSEGMEPMSKRNKRMRKQEKNSRGADEVAFRSTTEEVVPGVEEDESETRVVCSEEMEMHIAHIYEKMEQFTRQVSEMLEAGKATFKDLSTKFEERLIEIHKEQMERWEGEIEELRLLDVSNEEVAALLQSTRLHLLQNIQVDS